jgi:hypothetical protein
VKRATVVAALVAGAFGIGAGSAHAASGQASCAGIVVSAEAQSSPGFVGDEVRAEAGPGFGASVVGFAQAHQPTCTD